MIPIMIENVVSVIDGLFSFVIILHSSAECLCDNIAVLKFIDARILTSAKKFIK